MSSRMFRPEWSRVTLLRGVAIVSLVIAFVDLGTTLPCCAGEFGLPVQAVDSQADVTDARGSEHGNEHRCIPSSDDKSTDQPVNDSDGCFCCALGMPTVCTVAEDLRLPEPAIEPGGITLPTSSPSSPYRPPRFA